jgi:hypothetical protein
MDIKQVGQIDKAAVDHSKKIEKLQESHNIRRMDEYNEDNKNANQDRQIEAQEEKIAINTVEFGYNYKTDDLIIKIMKPDGTQDQYPTEDMLKLKTILKESFIES